LQAIQRMGPFAGRSESPASRLLHSNQAEASFGVSDPSRMKATIERFTVWVFRHRLPLVIVFGLLTVAMGWFAMRLHVDASFNKGLPLDHPYIRTFTKYQSEFGGANRVIIALMVRQGDIFTPEFFKLLKEATDDVFFLSGVDRAQVQSLFTPNVRYTEVVEDGFSGGNVIPPDFQPTPEGLARVRAERDQVREDRPARGQ